MLLSAVLPLMNLQLWRELLNMIGANDTGRLFIILACYLSIKLAVYLIGGIRNT